jgi:hypothetical protein
MDQGQDTGLKILTRIGLQDSLDKFQAILIPYCDPSAPTQFQAAVALTGTLMSKARFSDGVVALVVRELMKTGEGVLATGQGPRAIMSIEGSKLFIPDQQDGQLFDIQTLKRIEVPAIPEPLTVTVFSLTRAFQLCDVVTP